MQGIIIADTSCLILLSKLNELHVLRQLYHSVTITSVIANEYSHPLPSWVHIQDAANTSTLSVLQTTVDAGEASAIALALEQEKCLLIIDDMKARKLAVKLHINYTGTLGILLLAKQKGYLPSIIPIIKKIKLTNFHFPHELEQKVLALAGETD